MKRSNLSLAQPPRPADTPQAGTGRRTVGAAAPASAVPAPPMSPGHAADERSALALPPAPPEALQLPLQTLVAKLLGLSQMHPLRHLMLVGAAPGVGTSFVAGHLAAQLVGGFGAVRWVELRAADPTPAGQRPRPLAFHPRGPEAGALLHRVVPAAECLRLATRATGPLAAHGRGAQAPAAQETPPAGLAEALAAQQGLDAQLVVWDLPPLTRSPAALLLAPAVDGIVLVAAAHQTRRHAAQHSAERLRDSGGRLLGVVLNRAPSFIPDWLYRWL